MTRIQQMRRYLSTIYQNEPWIIRFLWALKLARMSDGEVIDTYHMLTDRR